MNLFKYSLLLMLVSPEVHAQTVDTRAYERYISTQYYYQPVQGKVFYLDGKVQDTHIKYEPPMALQDDAHPLIVMKNERKEKYVDKSELKAFFVDGHYFVPEDLGDSVIWVMLAHEGAIRETIYFQPNTFRETPSYYNVIRILTNQETHEGHFVGKLAINFKNVMSNMTLANEELSTKIKEKQKGYRFINYRRIVAEYNLWYDQAFPDKISYLLEKPDFEALVKKYSFSRTH